MQNREVTHAADSRSTGAIGPCGVHFDPLKVSAFAPAAMQNGPLTHETAVMAAPGSTLLGPDHFFPFQV